MAHVCLQVARWFSIGDSAAGPRYREPGAIATNNGMDEPLPNFRRVRVLGSQCILQTTIQLCSERSLVVPEKLQTVLLYACPGVHHELLQELSSP